MPQLYKLMVNEQSTTNAKWPFPRNYFPRTYKYKKEAVSMAKRVIEYGATFARIECPNGGELDFRQPQQTA